MGKKKIKQLADDLDIAGCDPVVTKDTVVFLKDKELLTKIGVKVVDTFLKDLDKQNLLFHCRRNALIP